MNSFMYNLSRIYGRYGMKAQKYSLLDPRGLSGRAKRLWHFYRITLVLILVFAAMLFFQNVWLFWAAFAADVAMLYCKGYLEEELDIELEPYYGRRPQGSVPEEEPPASG